MFSILACGSTFAGILQPFSKKFYWRNVELYTGAGMLVFSIVCFIVLREDNVSPKQTEDDEEPNPEKKKKGGLRTIVGSIVIWHISFVYLFTMEVSVKKIFHWVELAYLWTILFCNIVIF